MTLVPPAPISDAEGWAKAFATSTWRRNLRQFSRDRSALVGTLIIVVVVLLAAFGPWLAPYAPDNVGFQDRFASPSAAHLLGTDNLGRDELSRLLTGARISVGVAVVATVGVTLLGLLLGLVAGSYGKVADTVVSRVIDVLLALPTLILALVVVGVLGQGLTNLLIAIILVGWPSYARLVRGLALTVRGRNFVEAAHSLGASRRRIAVREILPNLLGPVIVLSTLDMGRTLLAVAGLSFLGFGAPPPTSEWGAMTAEAKSFLDRAPQLLIYPGLAVTLVVLAFNLAGDGARDLLDPHRRPDPRQRRLLVGLPRRRS